MKGLRFLLVLTLVWCLGISMSCAQKTTMTLDCQNPGWLSNKIAYGDQMTLRNLTVTGYLNGTDIVFLRGLLFDKSLKHLDLTDAHIVAGGHYAPQDDVLLSGSFYNTNKDTICFLALPSSLKK